MRLLIVQYGGDYREAVKRFAAGGEETYYGQKYSVDAVAKFGEKADEVATLCCLTEHPYNERLENGVCAIGTGFTRKIQDQKLLGLVKEFQPTHLILRTPNTAMIRWAIQSKLKILMMLADSFNSKGLRDKIRYYQLAKLLNNSQIDWVGNHGVTSGLSLANIGVNPNKIIPWDWPYEMTPNLFPAKNLQLNQETYEIFYVGLVIESKGVGDVIKAIAQLKTQGLSIRLKIAGKGDIESFKNQVRDLKIENSVEFLGLVPNKTIVPLMREADLVVVPSRHEYGEGFPKSINEALYSRTPIVASDHPMFLQKLK
ncbi:MAG TPA: glycosyltransferase, partial [Candidatus Obscuribacterales bacterium]